MEWFSSLSPVLQGLTATIFTWAVTALGAALVFFFKNVDRKILNSMLGFGAIEKPIMIALHAAQDSFGTATNVTGDGAIAILVDYIINKKKGNSISKEDKVI